VPLTFDGVVIQVEVLQLGADERDIGELVVGQVQHQQVGEVEGVLGQPLVRDLVVVEPDECQVGELLEVVTGDVFNVVPVQEELVDGTGHPGGHFPQDVVGEVELHEVLESLEGIFVEDPIA